MSNSLMEFLLENPVDNVTEQVELSQRLKGKLFSIRAMTGTEHNEYAKRATRIGKGRKVDFDTSLYNQLVVVNHTINPNFKDAETLKKAGCQTPEQLMNRVLLAGEIAELASRISSLSGFDRDMDDLVVEAKNS